MRIMRKKLTVLLLTAALCVQLAACGGKGAGSGEQDGAGQGSQQENTQNGDIQDTGGPDGDSQGAGSQDEGGPDGSVQDTAQGEDPEQAAAQAQLQALRDAVAEVLGEDYWPNTQMPPEFLADYGLKEDMYEGFLGEMPMISVNVDTLILIKAKEDQVEAVEAVLNSYRDALVSDTMQYPMNLGKIQASRIEVMGQYVCFVQLGADVTEGMEIGDEEIIRLCQEQNELAITAIEQAAAR